MGDSRSLISFTWFDFAMPPRDSIVTSADDGRAVTICASLASSVGEHSYTFSGRTAVHFRLGTNSYYGVL